MIRVDKIWLAVEPMDMRAGPDTALARVIKDFGQARPHHAYVFANKRANRMKILVSITTIASSLKGSVVAVCNYSPWLMHCVKSYY